MEEPASGSAFSSVQEIGHEQALSAALGPDKYTTSSFAQQPLGDREGINIQVEVEAFADLHHAFGHLAPLHQPQGHLNQQQGVSPTEQAGPALPSQQIAQPAAHQATDRFAPAAGKQPATAAGAHVRHVIGTEEQPEAQRPDQSAPAAPQLANREQGASGRAITRAVPPRRRKTQGQGQATAQAMPTKSAEVPDVPCALQRMRDVAAGAAPLCQIPPYARQRKQVEFAVYDAKVTRTTNELRQVHAKLQAADKQIRRLRSRELPPSREHFTLQSQLERQNDTLHTAQAEQDQCKTAASSAAAAHKAAFEAHAQLRSQANPAPLNYEDLGAIEEHQRLQEEMAKQARAVGEALQLKIRSAAEYANAQGRCTAAAQAVQQTKAALAEELDELQWAELVAQREAQQQRDRLWGALQLKQDELRLYICQHQISDAPSVLQIAATPTASQPMNQQPGHTRKPGRPTKRKLVSGAGPRPFDTAPKSSRRGWDGASPGAGATNGPASAAGAAEGTLGLQHVACASKEAAQRLETPAQGSLAAATDADMHQSLSSLARRFRPIAAHAESGGADMDRSLSSLARRAGPPAGRAGSGSAAAAASAPRRAERSRAAQLPNENLAAAAHSDIAANDNAALEVEQMRKLKTHLQTLGVQLGSGWHAQVLFHLTGHLAGMPYFQYYNAADQRFRSMKEVARSLGASVARDT